jgi:hypothetical protein
MPPAPAEALRLKTEWERLTSWSAYLIRESDGAGPLAELLRLCRRELTDLLAAANQDRTRRDEASV